MRAYWDTSALVKIYAVEPGSAEASTLRRTYDCLSSVLLPIELRSALHRRRAGGHISLAAYRAAEARITEDRTAWELSTISVLVLQAAETLVARLTVKSLDAIHIATAEDMQEGLGTKLPFITADKRQAEAAAAAGLQVQLIAGD